MVEIEKTKEWEVLTSLLHSVTVIDYYADWCEKCPAMMELLESIESDPDFERVSFFKVDIDKLPDVKERARIKVVPMVLIYREGFVRDWFFGEPNKDKLYHKIRMQLKHI